MAGRLAGFARELMLASAFGLSAQADVAIVLLTLPDLLVNLLLSGGLSVALVPAMRGRDASQQVRLFAQASLAVTVLFSLLALAFVWQPSNWLGVLAPGVALSSMPTDVWMWATVAVALPLTALSGVSSAALNAGDRFFVAGCGTLIFNLCVMAALLVGLARGATPTAVLLLLGVGIAAGALLRWLSQWLALSGSLRRLDDPRVGPASWRGLFFPWLLDGALMRSFAAGLASASLLVLVPVLIRACASWLGSGQLAAFNYAIKLVELPLGILITTLATVAYPRLSECHAQGDEAGFRKLLADSLRRSLVISFAVLLCGWQFGDALVSLLLGHGRLGRQEQDQVSQLMQLALLSVPGVGVVSLLSAALNASQRAGTVLRCTLWALLALPLLCLPGLLLKSPQALMWALPGVQLLLALFLVFALGIPRMGEGAQGAPKILPPLLALSLPCALGVMADTWLRQALASASPMQLLLGRLLLAACVFALAMAAGLRALQLSPSGQERLDS